MRNMNEKQKKYEKLQKQRKALKDFYSLILQGDNWHCWNDTLEIQHFQPVAELSKKDLAGLTNQFSLQMPLDFEEKKEKTQAYGEIMHIWIKYVPYIVIWISIMKRSQRMKKCMTMI